MSLAESINVVQASAVTDEDKAKLSRLLRLVSRSCAQMNGDELKEAREAAGLSVGQAAQLIGVSRDHLQQLETEDGWKLGSAYHPLVRRIDEVYGLYDGKRCKHCGCTEFDGSQCHARIGKPCQFIDDNTCSACASRGKF